MSGRTLTGYARADGDTGIRNRMLVLPSVVCATQVARELGEDAGAAAIVHQHGCLHVGDDLVHTERMLLGAALNPNIGAVLVVGLGCETIQGAKLARTLSERRPGVDYVGIQITGGTARALERGRAIVHDRLAELAGAPRMALEPGRIRIGIDRAGDPLAEPLRAALEARGFATVVSENASAGGAHVELAAQGVHAIVSLCGSDEPPLGSAICPLIAVARDPELYLALADDFDVVAADGCHQQQARLIVEAVLAACAGEPTAAERRGALDFVLERRAVTM
ncbi:MAG: UxaA family hydrolase [Solirubrobacteraceae bacterium]